MTEYNCSALKRLPVPDGLIEKALVIPENADKKPTSLPWYRNIRVVAAAASVVLVATLGISVYFLFGNKSPIPIAPKPAVSATEAATQTATEVGKPPTSTPETETASDPKTTATDAYRATQSPSQPAPTVITVPIPSTRVVEPTVPAPTQGASAVPIATQTPSVQPTEPTIALQTDPIGEHDPAAPPPTVDHDLVGSAPVPGAPGKLLIKYYIETDLLTGSGKVYCVLYDRAGNRVDNEDILSPKHLAVTTESYDDVTCFLYYIPEEWNLPTGMYDMVTYNEDGVLIREKKPIFLYH